ncbi:hypothetical protein [Streptomyces griseoluteus]|uniref:hypothetical protein n=1 Tax=Streptomyces griseoluteus TaxID=29306 RepID=UPI003702674C
MNRHLRKAVVASVAITAGLLMTACQSGSDTATASGTSTASTAGTATETPRSQKTGGSERQGAQQGSGADSSTGSGSGSGSNTVSPSRDTAVEGIDKGHGVNGTWFGNVTYLAPGKYTVSDQKGTEQEFLLAEDTDIIGYDDICGDPGAADGTKCTETQLETAAKKGFSAEVVIKNGIATSIHDDH